jgi:hypothetical protein
MRADAEWSSSSDTCSEAVDESGEVPNHPMTCDLVAGSTGCLLNARAPENSSGWTLAWVVLGIG